MEDVPTQTPIDPTSAPQESENQEITDIHQEKEKNKKRIYVLITIFVFLFLVSAAGLGTLIYKKGQDNTLFAPKTAPTSIPTPIISQSSTTKTYAGKDYSFMYPANYEILIDKMYSADGVTASVPGTTTLVAPPIPNTSANFQMSIKAEDKPFDAITADTAKAAGNTSIKEVYEIDNKSGYIFKDTNLGRIGATIIYVENNGATYSITIESNTQFAKIQQSVDQILSTFKFTN